MYLSPPAANPPGSSGRASPAPDAAPAPSSIRSSPKHRSALALHHLPYQPLLCDNHKIILYMYSWQLHRDFTFSGLPCKWPKEVGNFPQRKVPLLRALDISKCDLYSKLNCKHKPSQAVLCYRFLRSTHQHIILWVRSYNTPGFTISFFLIARASHARFKLYCNPKQLRSYFHPLSHLPVQLNSQQVNYFIQVKLYPLFPNNNKITWWNSGHLPLPGGKMLTAIDIAAKWVVSF